MNFHMCLTHGRPLYVFFFCHKWEDMIGQTIEVICRILKSVDISIWPFGKTGEVF